MVRRFINRAIGLLLCLGLLLSIGSLAWPQPARAQTGSGSDGHGNYWRHYTTDDGLLSNTVQTVAHTEDPVVDASIPGLWIGTDAGLNYTDGRNWVNYTTANSDLPDADVRAILNSSQPGELWIATASGVARLDYARTPRDRDDDAWQIFPLADSLPTAEVLSLALINDQVWAGTTEGVAHYTGSTWRAYVHDPLGSEARALAHDPDRNALWVATGDGLGALNLTFKTWTVFHAGERRFFVKRLWIPYRGCSSS